MNKGSFDDKYWHSPVKHRCNTIIVSNSVEQCRLDMYNNYYVKCKCK